MAASSPLMAREVSLGKHEAKGTYVLLPSGRSQPSQWCMKQLVMSRWVR